MKTYPAMDVRFPEDKESELVAAMRARCTPPWQWRPNTPRGTPAADDECYFDRDATLPYPACTLCIHRKAAGNLEVFNIVPEKMGTRLSIDQYVGILNEFGRIIAEPTASERGGVTGVETHIRKLEGYFTAESVSLLERFCKSSNAGDGGSHPDDQRKWMAFLLHFHRTGKRVSVVTFGDCLKAKNWWPETGIDKLKDEYDFAMRLLRQEHGNERRRARNPIANLRGGSPPCPARASAVVINWSGLLRFL